MGIRCKINSLQKEAGMKVYYTGESKSYHTFKTGVDSEILVTVYAPKETTIPGSLHLDLVPDGDEWREAVTAMRDAAYDPSKQRKRLDALLAK